MKKNKKYLGILIIIILGIILIPNNVIATESFSDIIEERNGEYYYEIQGSYNNLTGVSNPLYDTISSEIRYRTAGKVSVDSCDEGKMQCIVVDNDANTPTDITINITDEEDDYFYPEFAAVLNQNHQLVIPLTSAEMDKNGKETLIQMYLHDNYMDPSNTDDTIDTTGWQLSCNADVNKCMILREENVIVETHVVEVIFDEEFSDNFKTHLNVNDEGILEIGQTSFEYYDYFESFVYTFLPQNDEVTVYINSCDEETQKCDITLDNINTNIKPKMERHVVKVEINERYIKFNTNNILSSDNKIVIPYTGFNEKDLLDQYLVKFSNDSEYFHSDVCRTIDNKNICETKLRNRNTHDIIEMHLLEVLYESNKDESIILKTLGDKLTVTETSNISDVTSNSWLDIVVNKFDTDLLDFYLSSCQDNASGEKECEIIAYDSNYEIMDIQKLKVEHKEEFSSEFKRFLNEKNELVITSSTKDDKNLLISELLERFNDDKTSFNMNSYSCVDDNTQDNFMVCDITRDVNNTQAEIHAVKIVFNEVFSDEFKKLLNENNKFQIMSIMDDDIQSITMQTNLYSTDEIRVEAKYCEMIQNMSTEPREYRCDLELYEVTDNGLKLREKHVVTAVFGEEFSNIFKQLLNNNKLVVPLTSMVYSNEELLKLYVNSFDTDTVNFEVEECQNSNDTLECKVDLYNYGNYAESHVLEINYEESYSDSYKKILNSDNVFIFKALEPKDKSDMDLVIQSVLDNYTVDNYIVYYRTCNNDYTLCDITLSDKDWIVKEIHTVKVGYEQANEDIRNQINEDLAKLEQYRDEADANHKPILLTISDLELINYFAVKKSITFDNISMLSDIAPYSQILRDTFSGANYKYEFFPYWNQSDFGDLFSHNFGGSLALKYNDIVYSDLIDFTISMRPIIYVPSDTELTKDALIEAALKRIKDYAPNLDIKITEGKSFDQISYNANESRYDTFAEYLESIIDVDKTTNNSFTLKIKDIEVDILIVADSSKCLTPDFYTYDVDSNISVDTNSTDIPLDARVEVEEITSGEEFERIIKILDVDNYAMYDIKLHSTTMDKYITKLENGKFEVRIPIPKNLEGKDIQVYYVDKDGNVTTYDVVVENGYAVFETDHFSIYTLAAKKSSGILPPSTFDGIGISIFMGAISLIGLAGATIYLRKKNKVRAN